MDFKQLTAFVTVIEQGSFSRAAEVLYLTQPTVSAHIQQLESELGTKLLMRTTKELSPTEAGKLLYRYGRKLIDIREEAYGELEKLRDGGRSSISLSVSTVPAQSFLPMMIAAYQRTHSGVLFQVSYGDSRKAEQLLLSGHAELALMGTVPSSTRCISEPFADDTLVVITPVTPRYTELGGVFPLELLTREPYINRETGSGTRTESETLLRSVGIAPESLNTVAEVRSTDGVKSMVSQGVGISIVSKAASDDYTRLGKVLSFPLGDLSLIRKLYIVHLRKCSLSRPASEFLRFVKNHGWETQ